MSAKTRADFIKEVAERYGQYRRLTASGGSTTTIVDADGLYEADDFWIGHYAYILTDAGGAGAAPQGEERPVTDYDQSTTTLTVAPAFTAAVANGDTYELLPERRDRIIDAINAGVQAAGETWPILKRDTTTLTIVADDYDYSLSTITDLVRLLNVSVRDATDEAWIEAPKRNWRVTGTPAAYVLLFDSLTGLEAGDALMLEYTAYPTEMTADTGALGVGVTAERGLVRFVVAYALGWLNEAAASRGDGGFRERYTLAERFMEEAQVIKRSAARVTDAGKMRWARWGRSRG